MMRIVMFYHSLVSDWNHGNAHFLRGVVTELLDRGHDVIVYETRNGWSLSNLLEECGEDVLDQFRRAYPQLRSAFYDVDSFAADELLEGADLVLVHEWTDRRVIEAIGDHRRRHDSFRLLFHDTHHRSVTADSKIAKINLSAYDGVLAFGSVIRDIYLDRGWVSRAWTWHEAADTRVFQPTPHARCIGDIAWIGNWGDDERAVELSEFLIEPVQALRLNATVHGVRYPETARRTLAEAGIQYRGYISNYDVPAVLNSHRLTAHIPRRPYTKALPGIPTIRVFEALACGVPLICSPWDDRDGLFQPGEDFLIAKDGPTMMQLIAALLDDPDTAARLGAHGRETILARHTCAHRVNELLAICRELGLDDNQFSDQTVREAGRMSLPSRSCSNNFAANGEGPSEHNADVNAPRPLIDRAAHSLDIAFFGSSLVSSYWNGAATYYRGIIRALAELGHRVTFYEPDVLDRQKHRDIPDPSWARVVVYAAQSKEQVLEAVALAEGAEVVVKASGVGAFDDLLEREVLELQNETRRVIFWDVDAPATLHRIHTQPGDQFNRLIPRFDAVFTYGGGEAVVRAYQALGAQLCVPIYNALDPMTHFPVARDDTLACDLVFLGNRLPDREARVREFFFSVAEALPAKSFLLGGSGWDHYPLPPNVRRLGHVPTSMHNALNCSAKAVLNISRQSMADVGFSPATRVFEAAGAGACIITDEWEGIETFLKPEEQVLVASHGREAAAQLDHLDHARAEAIGRAARQRVLDEHTYGKRAKQVAELLASELQRPRRAEVRS